MATANITPSSVIPMFSASNTSTTSAPLSHAPPPELEQALAQLSSHRTVLGYITLSRSIPFSIIKSSGVVFEGEQGKKYASAVEKIVNAVEGSLTELSANGRDADPVRFMRIRTKRHELMITPDTHYVLVVLQDPSS